MRVLTGRQGVPHACAHCRLTFAELKAISPGSDVRMYLHPMDGVAVFLCKPCSDAYERKRLDVYGSTPYGERKKLKGAK